MPYVRFWSAFKKASVLHTFAHWVVKFWAISINQYKAADTGVYMDVPYCASDQMRQKAFSWYFKS